MDITGKNIIVTGGASGIGKTLVTRLIEEDGNVCVFDIDQDASERLIKEFPKVHYSNCDVSNNEQVETSVNEFFNKFNSIDILINNAAFIYNSLLISFGKVGFVKHDIHEWEKVIRTDLSSVFYMTVNAVEKMILKRTKGLIINVSSISSNGNIGQSAYSAAKAGVNSLTYLWAKELCNFNIRVAGIAPGFIKTDTTMQSISENIINDLIKRTPTKRLGEPFEVAEGILFIIKNDFFNGKVLELDGGLNL